MAVSRATSEKLYREYMTFFEKAEKHRRWSIFDDVPWDKLESTPKDPVLALCAETFCGVEMYLPDYDVCRVRRRQTPATPLATRQRSSLRCPARAITTVQVLA